MLEKVLTLYSLAMGDREVREVVPHLHGPPGSGKSTIVQQAGDLLGVNVHTINVSRISPLDLEGVQMPVDNNSRLQLLPATFWTALEPGDIILWDEFLHGFPEVYRGILDIFTARQVGPLKLPPVFMIAASNTKQVIDTALEDRLIHIEMSAPNDYREILGVAERISSETGMFPRINPPVSRGGGRREEFLSKLLQETRVPMSPEARRLGVSQGIVPLDEGDPVQWTEFTFNQSVEILDTLIDQWQRLVAESVLPTYQLPQNGARLGTESTTSLPPMSARKWAGVIKLHQLHGESEVPDIQNLITANNNIAMITGRFENYYYTGSATPTGYTTSTGEISSDLLQTLIEAIEHRLQEGSLSDAERDNANANLQLIQLDIQKGTNEWKSEMAT